MALRRSSSGVLGGVNGRGYGIPMVDWRVLLHLLFRSGVMLCCTIWLSETDEVMRGVWCVSVCGCGFKWVRCLIAMSISAIWHGISSFWMSNADRFAWRRMSWWCNESPISKCRDRRWSAERILVIVVKIKTTKSQRISNRIVVMQKKKIMWWARNCLGVNSLSSLLFFFPFTDSWCG